MYNDNVVSFAKKVNFDIGCQMDFHKYPIDLQKCPVNIQSFRYRPQVTLNFWGSSCIMSSRIGTSMARLPPFPLKIII